MEMQISVLKSSLFSEKRHKRDYLEHLERITSCDEIANQTEKY